MKEEYKPIKGFDNYEVSNLGRIRNKKTNLIKKNHTDRDGYVRIGLRRKENNKSKYYTYSIHRLVAIAFIPNPNNLPEVNHKDEDKTNNRVDNLEWCDRKYNCRYGSRNIRVGIKNGKPILQYDLNGNFIREWSSVMEATHSLQYKSNSIQQCCKGKTKTSHNYIWKYK